MISSILQHFERRAEDTEYRGRKATAFSRTIFGYYNDNSLDDVIFEVGNEMTGIEEISGIRNLFAFHSDALKAMLFGNMFELNKNNRIIINDVSPMAFKILKVYVYGGDLENCVALTRMTTNNESVLVDIFFLCDKYMITGFADKVGAIVNGRMGDAIISDAIAEEEKNESKDSKQKLKFQTSYINVLNELDSRNLTKYIGLIFNPNTENSNVNYDGNPNNDNLQLYLTDRIDLFFVSKCLSLLNPTVLQYILFNNPNENIKRLTSQTLFNITKQYCIDYVERLASINNLCKDTLCKDKNGVNADNGDIEMKTECQKIMNESGICEAPTWQTLFQKYFIDMINFESMNPKFFVNNFEKSGLFSYFEMSRIMAYYLKHDKSKNFNKKNGKYIKNISAMIRARCQERGIYNRSNISNAKYDIFYYCDEYLTCASYINDRIHHCLRLFESWLKQDMKHINSDDYIWIAITQILSNIDIMEPSRDDASKVPKYIENGCLQNLIELIKLSKTAIEKLLSSMQINNNNNNNNSRIETFIERLDKNSGIVLYLGKLSIVFNEIVKHYDWFCKEFDDKAETEFGECINFLMCNLSDWQTVMHCCHLMKELTEKRGYRLAIDETKPRLVSNWEKLFLNKLYILMESNDLKVNLVAISAFRNLLTPNTVAFCLENSQFLFKKWNEYLNIKMPKKSDIFLDFGFWRCCDEADLIRETYDVLSWLVRIIGRAKNNELMLQVIDKFIDADLKLIEMAIYMATPHKPHKSDKCKVDYEYNIYIRHAALEHLRLIVKHANDKQLDMLINKYDIIQLFFDSIKDNCASHGYCDELKYLLETIESLLNRNCDKIIPFIERVNGFHTMRHIYGRDDMKQEKSTYRFETYDLRVNASRILQMCNQTV